MQPVVKCELTTECLTQHFQTGNYHTETFILCCTVFRFS